MDFQPKQLWFSDSATQKRVEFRKKIINKSPPPYINFRTNLHIFMAIVSWKPNLRNRTFEITRKILVKNTEKWSKFVWKSEKIAKISIDQESLYSQKLILALGDRETYYPRNCLC